MSTHKHHSWGRTRRPKELRQDAPSALKQSATTVTTVTAATLDADMDSDTAGAVGYSTENQDYLHIMLTDDNTDETLTLYGYNYAFGAWAPLYIPVGGGATANATYVLAEFAGINGSKLFTVPIHGIDRIAFVHDSGGVDANFIVRAACSTF